MKTSRLGLIIKIVITIAILGYIITRIPLLDVWHSLKKANILYVAAAYSIIIGMRYFIAYRTKIFTNIHNMRISIQQFFEISLVSSFYGFFLPGTLAGGAVRWYKISKAGDKPAESMTAIIYDRLISTLVLVMVGTIFWLIERHMQSSQGMGLVLLATLSALALTYVLAFNGKVALLLIRITQTLFLIPELVREKVKKVLFSSMDYRRISERKHIEIFMLSLLYDFFGILAIYLLSLSLDLPLTLIQLGWIRSIVTILSMLPISFSGIGVREGSMILLLQTYSVAPANALALSFLVLLGNIVLALCGGLIELKNLSVLDKNQDDAQKTEVLP
jgi:uncharacterized protein (TIRG00374 family)